MSDIIYSSSSIEYKNGKIQHKNYKSTSDSMYQIASCSKFVTSIVVAKLYELGKLDYTTDINKYLKKWKCPKKGVTLKHLLTHTSGTTDRNGYLGMELNENYKQNLQLNMDILNGDSYSKPFNITKPIGKEFNYSGAGYQVIQQVLEEITNKRLYQLLEQYIFKPLKMKNSTGKLLYEGKHKYKLCDTNGLYRLYPETAAAGVWMSPNDLFILVKDLMNGYNDNQSKILTQETIQKITKGEHPKWNNIFSNYGLGMFVNKDNDNISPLFAHNGENYAYMMHFHCIPDKEIIDIIMINYSPKYYNKVESEAKKLMK